MNIRQLVPTPPAFDTAVGSDPVRILQRSLAPENYSPWVIMLPCLLHPMCSHFSITLTLALANSALTIASVTFWLHHMHSIRCGLLLQM